MLFTFISQDPESTILQKELEAAERRSHAARIAHQRRRAKVKPIVSRLDARLGGRSAPPIIGDTTGGEPTQNSPPKMVTCPTNTRPGVSEATQVKALSRYFRGNCDPFASYAIAVTPRINQALTFMREAVYPAIYFYPIFRQIYGSGLNSTRNDWLPARFAKQGWEFATASLRDEGLALACIASHVVNLATFLPPTTDFNSIHLALALTTKSSKILREKLVATESSSDVIKEKSLITHVYWLLRSNIYLKDMKAITLHGDMLSRAVVKGIQDGTVDMMIMVQASALDTDVSAKYMRRTWFDYKWFAKVCARIWLVVEPQLPSVRAEVFTNLHPLVTNEDLRQVFLQARHRNNYAEYPPPDSAWGSHAQKAGAYHWFATRSLWGLGTIMKVYQDLRDECGAAFTFGTVEQHTQAAIALGLLFYSRAFGHTVFVNGVNLRDASDVIMPQLKELMQHILDSWTDEELNGFEDVYLWLLYLGAFHERRSFSKLIVIPQVWFQHELVNRAVKAKKTKWINLQPILERFLHVGWLEPHGSRWFDRLVDEVGPLLDL